MWESCASFPLSSILGGSTDEKLKAASSERLAWTGCECNADLWNLTFFRFLNVVSLAPRLMKGDFERAIKLIFYTEGFLVKETDTKTRGLSLSWDVLSKGPSDTLLNG